jgi:hypothetical protein
MDKIDRIIWEAPEHIKPEKKDDWFWIIGIFAVAAIILSIYFNNILFALIILFGILIIFTTANKPPRVIEFEINKKGIRIEKVLYTYANLESFYLVDEDGYERDRILIKSKKLFVPLIVLPIGNVVDHNIISEFLIEYLHEEELHESTLQKMMQNLGF